MRTVPLCLILFALAACDLSQTVYYAPGVTVAAREADLAQCQAGAFAQYPVRNETRYTPRRYVPPLQICDANGNCRLRPGFFEGGDPYTVDVNRTPRAAATRACMAAEGYTQIELPRCEPGTTVQRSTGMPPLSAGSCILQNPVGPEIATAL